MPDTAISVQGLSKEFILPQHKTDSLKQSFVTIGRKKIKKHQVVLNDISFQIENGDFFGIVGRNGSGKSTLLKLLAGVYTPTKGNIQVNGPLTPFIELGVGFNPELSGRDNIFLNGALLGFSRNEMKAMYEEIVDFAELHEFMDQKLKNYSSGMQVRLAFSIAVKAKNDILIFDEVLAVGDEAFQRKCIDVFEQYKASKQTVVLVTHDMATVKKFCNRALLIDKGKIVEYGDPREVANTYSELNQEETDRSVEAENNSVEKAKAKHLVVSITSESKKPVQSFKLGEKCLATVTWSGLDTSKLESIGVNIFKESGEHVTGINTRSELREVKWSERDKIQILFNLAITPGKYHLVVEAFSSPGQVIDAITSGPKFSVISQSEMKWSGIVELEHEWRL